MKRIQMLTCAESSLNCGNYLANFIVEHGNIIHSDVFAWLPPCQHMLTRCVNKVIPRVWENTVATEGMLGNLNPLGDGPCFSLADHGARVPEVLPAAELEGFLTLLYIVYWLNFELRF